MTIRIGRVKLNRRGMRELLRSEGVQDMLARKADPVAAQVEAAGIRVDGDRVPLPVTIEVDAGAERARARIILDHPAGLAVEAKHALLAGAIDAARTVS